uniref:Clustered mitochondria protein homolog n=1 Tax=Plectus sambesii TaxID=2011161 RepID=A0A914UNE2_9BILA
MYRSVVAHSLSCCRDPKKAAVVQEKKEETVKMCEDKTVAAEQPAAEAPTVDAHNTLPIGDMSPMSTDSGHESAASTPEAPLTPHEERSATPSENATEELISYSNDAVYRIRIMAPNAEPFDLQVNSGEMVQELHQVLLERDSTCHRTCFSLQLDGVPLDHFTELKNIEGMKDGAVLKVAEGQTRRCLRSPSAKRTHFCVGHAATASVIGGGWWSTIALRLRSDGTDRVGFAATAAAAVATAIAVMYVSKRRPDRILPIPSTIYELSVEVLASKCRHCAIEVDLLERMADAQVGDVCSGGCVWRVVARAEPAVLFFNGRSFAEPYTIRETRIHLRHVRDLIRALDPADAVNGVEGASMSFVNTIMANNDRKRPNALERSIDCTPPDYVLPGNKDRPLTHLQPQNKDMANVQCVKSIALSGYNPPPGNRKMRGDVMYLVVYTLENRRYHITCCTKGFFVNQSTGDEFNPKPVNQKAIYHSLIELLSHISPGFKRNLAIVQKKRAQKHIFERLPTPYQVHSWMVSTLEHNLDGIRAEDGTQPHRIGLEDHIPGQIRDWNEELQTTHELPRKTLPDRLIRERAIFKIHSDFVAAAIKGAMSVVDGNVMAINPADDPRTHMYIWNNIFFSLGFDVKDHYKALGGDAAAFVATANDLQGVRAYAALDHEKLYTLGMVLVDYRGYRVTAQSIIPGILEREQEQSVVYGSVDFGKTVVSSEKYHELLEKPAQQLKIYPHLVKSGKDDGKDVKLYSSFETKGIVGNDSRHYVLDLLRTFPPDVNYLADAEVTEICRANGFPRKFPHKLACLRQELIDAFVDARYMTFVRIAAYHLQQLRTAQLEEKKEEQEKATPIAASPSERLSADSGVGSPSAITEESTQCEHDGDRIVKEIKNKMTANCGRDASPEGDAEALPEPETAKRIVEESISPKKATEDASAGVEAETAAPGATEAATKQIIRKAAQAVGSLSDTEFDIRFNPDCYCDTVVHSDADELTRQRKLVAEAAQFLLVHQIPQFVRDCLEHSLTPVDGFGLSEAMHARGINMRYLGKIVECLSDIAQLEYFKTVCMCELACRSAKHVLRGYLQGVGQASLGTALAHFLNCLTGSFASPQPSVSAEDMASVKRTKGSKKRKGQSSTLAHDSLDWAQLTPKLLWQQVAAEMDAYYGYSIDSEHCDAFAERYNVQKISILRRFCLITGIQIVLKDYNLDNKTRASLGEEDIQNMFPIVKHVNPKAQDAQNFLHTGQAKIQQGQLRAGFDLIAEALNLMNNVYGAMHAEIAQCMRLLARLAYILGDPAEALAQQHKATLMSERCCGIDHPQTIVEYMNLAHFSFANLQISTSLKLLYRARYLLLLCHGENHPLMAQIDSNIGVVLYAVQEYDFALKFLNQALKLHILYTGANSLKTALIYHLMARAHSCRGDFRTALQNEKETFTIYCKTFGEDHEKTKESGECLRHLTQQAVTFQKRMNEASRNQGSISQLLPLQIQQPSLQSVLEVLNILNGIIFIQLGGGKDSKLDEMPDSNGGVKITELSDTAEEAEATTPVEQQPAEVALD